MQFIIQKGGKVSIYAGFPHARFEISLSWARISLQRHISPLGAYKGDMALTPQVIWLGNRTGLRYQQITLEIKDADIEADAVSITLR
jgi:hypothetical protein